MELKSPFFIISSFIFLLIFLAKIYKHKIKARSHKLPPGPWKLPLIGNLHQLALAGKLPHHTIGDLSHKYGPLMHLQLGKISAVVVSSPNLTKEIMRTHDLAFVERPRFLASNIFTYESKDIVFSSYGDYWRQMRKICTLELLSAKRVQSFSSVREDGVEKMIEFIHSSTCQDSLSVPLDLSKMISSLVSSFILRATFGKKSKYEDELLCLLKQAMEMGGFDVADLFPSFKPIHFISGMKPRLENLQKKLDMIFESIINEHQSNHGLQGENIVDVLLHIQQSGSLNIPITHDSVKAVIWDMFSAGSDTSAITINWAMSELMKNPRVRKKAQAEIREATKGKKRIYESDLHELSYLKLVIKETLRLHPPVAMFMRECREPCNIAGYEIPIKTKLIFNAQTIGRDPKYWSDADKFIPERFHDNTGFDFNKVNGNSFQYIPFGGGRRMCPGILFGLANIELPLAALLYHFDWKIPNEMKEEDLDMTEVFGVTVSRKNNLFLIPTPYV